MTLMQTGIRTMGEGESGFVRGGIGLRIFYWIWASVLMGVQLTELIRTGITSHRIVDGQQEKSNMPILAGQGSLLLVMKG
jgi:hypothetical protein